MSTANFWSDFGGQPRVISEESDSRINTLFAGDGEMATLMRSLDWSQTPLGSVSSWSLSLKMIIRTLLASQTPMQLLWGPEYIQFYNDAYRPILGEKHPTALGQRGSECWQEVWDFAGPRLEQVKATGRASSSSHQLLLLERHGYVEECYFSFSYTPVHEVSGEVGGIFVTVAETTQQILNNRRQQVLNTVTARIMAAQTIQNVCAIAAETLTSDPDDLPFALLYLLDPDSQKAHLAATVHLPPDTPVSPAVIDLSQTQNPSHPWFYRDDTDGNPVLLRDLGLPLCLFPKHHWDAPPHAALILPLAASARSQPGFLVMGISPRLGFDDSYRQFFEIIASHISIAIASAHAYEKSMETLKLQQEAAHREERLKAEAEAAKAQVIDVLEKITDGFFSLDRDWQFTYVNQASERLSGKSREELLGQSIWDVYPSLVGTPFEQQLRRAIADQVTVQIETPSVHVGLWREVNAYPHQDGLSVYWRDITERRRAEETLRKREEELRLITNAVPVLIAYVDREQRYRFGNRTYEAWFGYPFQEVDGKQIQEVLGEEAYEMVRPYVERVLSGETVSFEGEVPYRDGGVRHVNATYIPRINSEGTIEGYVGLVSDISDRKRAEEALRRSEDRYRTLANAVSQLMWINDPQGKIQFFNQRWHEYTGVDLELGVELWPKIIHSDDFQHILTIKTHAIQTKEAYEVECRLKRFDQTYRWHLARIVPLKDEQGDVLYWFGTATDIEDIKRVEAEQRFLADASSALAASLDYESLLSRIAHLAVPFLADFCFFDLVKSDRKIQRVAWHHGDPEEQAWFDEVQRHVPSPDFDQHPGVHVLLSGEPVLIPEVTNERMQSIATSPEHLKFLQKSQLRSFMTVALVARHQNLGTLTLCLRQQSHRNYTQADLDLAQELARRAALALDHAYLYQQAQEANRIKDEFLAVLSHELRSPLNPILGWAKLLQSRKLDEATTERALATIERNAKVQTQLIDDLLDVARILRGKLALEVNPVDLRVTIEAAIETVRLAADAKAIAIQTHLAADVGLVAGDAGRLLQVVWNLLSNAVKFTPAGGQVEVKLEQIEQGVDEQMARQTEPLYLPISSYAQITVSDTGKGIAPEFQPYIFDYFRQADSSTTRQFGGLGLGLAIVRHIVELHGGVVHANSPGEEQGSTFTVKLPLLKTDQPIPDQHPPNASFRMALQGLRVLVVDDEADTRELLTMIVRQAGALVVTVSSAQEVLQVLSQSQMDVLVSDIGMPQMDGYTLIQHIRALESQADIPAIALTAYAGEANQHRVLAAGFQQHLAKPVEPDILVAAIASLAHKLADQPRG